MGLDISQQVSSLLTGDQHVGSGCLEHAVVCNYMPRGVDADVVYARRQS